MSAVQIDAETIIVERMAVLRATEDGDDDRRIASAAHPAPFRMRCGLRIHGVAFDGGSRRILVWSGRVAEVYYVDDGSVKSISRFETRAIAMAIRGESIFAAVGDQIVVMNDEGVVKQRVTFLEAEVRFQALSLCLSFLIPFCSPPAFFTHLLTSPRVFSSSFLSRTGCAASARSKRTLPRRRDVNVAD